MFHNIEFALELTADLEISPKHPLERVLIHKGTCVQAQVRPYVVETDQGPVEVADLFFDNGTAIRMVPFAYFTFVE